MKNISYITLAFIGIRFEKAATLNSLERFYV